MCLLLYASSVGHHLGFVSGRFSRGVPSSLNLTDEEIVHPPDLALYRLLEGPRGAGARGRAEQWPELVVWRERPFVVPLFIDRSSSGVIHLLFISREVRPPAAFLGGAPRPRETRELGSLSRL